MGAAAALACFTPFSIPIGGKLNLESGVPFGLGFGTAISADPIGTTLVLQPGLYNVHFEAFGVQQITIPQAAVVLTLNGQSPSTATTIWLMTQLQPGPPPTGFIIGDQFVRISAANTTASFVAPTGMNFAPSLGCLINITKLQ